MIGAGSVGFTRALTKDILAVPELVDTEFAFTDISKTNLEMVAALCKRDIKEYKLPAKVRTSTNRIAMLEGADHVFCMIRQGGLGTFQTDIEHTTKVPESTTAWVTRFAPGGIMYAQRTIPALLEFCREIRAVARPDVLLMNYANPMAMIPGPAIATAASGRSVFATVQGAHRQITRCIERWAKNRSLLDRGETLHRRDVDVIAAGINHQTWFIKVEWRGIDFVPMLLELYESHPEILED